MHYLVPGTVISTRPPGKANAKFFLKAIPQVLSQKKKKGEMKPH